MDLLNLHFKGANGEMVLKAINLLSWTHSGKFGVILASIKGLIITFTLILLQDTSAQKEAFYSVLTNVCR